MNRTEIINKLIRNHNYKSYLEIGLDDGINFRSVDCETKESCDPYIVGDTNVNLEHPDVMAGGDLREDIREILTYRMTSDEMFNKNDKKYDIIFIDGLHERHQVLRDIKNAMGHLNENGVVILHDCLPPRESCQIVPRITGEWNGDVWKVLPYLQEHSIFFYVVDTDYGCGVIPYTNKRIWVNEFDYDYHEYFDDRFKRDLRLNVISIDTFNEQEPE